MGGKSARLCSEVSSGYKRIHGGRIWLGAAEPPLILVRSAARTRGQTSVNSGDVVHGHASMITDHPERELEMDAHIRLATIEDAQAISNVVTSALRQSNAKDYPADVIDRKSTRLNSSH